MPTYSIGQAAGLLGVSAETVRRWADGGQLHMDRDGAGNRVIDGVSLAAFAKERGTGLHPVPGEGLTSVRNAPILLATALDGGPLDGAGSQLVVPSDRCGARYISAITGIWVGAWDPADPA
ncbi:helix-turn-helix domain-containing protein [Streptomyces kronopolitis]|uniref:helix-turn-helix domain-containing protein n=1 Tax=Streptomyces kronopolitis TaxID=1612435 RepID=UPI003427237F